MKSSLLPGLVLLASICFIPLAELSAQATAPLPAPIPPPPPPNLLLPAPVELGPTATFAFEGGGALKTKARGKTGRFELIGIQPLEKVEIDLQFPAALINARLTAHSLDGGKLSLTKKESLIPSDGIVSLHFQPGDQIGLYRVLVRAGGSESTLKFWVLDEDAKKNPPTLSPLLEEAQ